MHTLSVFFNSVHQIFLFEYTDIKYTDKTLPLPCYNCVFGHTQALPGKALDRARAPRAHLKKALESNL